MNEEIENSFAVGEDGAYIASDKRMYRFKATKNGVPRIIWKKTYQNSGIVKPSQLNAGTGTTPTIMDNGYVAITDNADPMNVVVYRTAKKLHGEKRTVCEVPVFEPGASATENSLITAGRSLIVENNYGYQRGGPRSRDWPVASVGRSGSIISGPITGQAWHRGPRCRSPPGRRRRERPGCGRASS